MMSDRHEASSPASNQKLFALSGILAPIIFTAVVIILAALRPDYSHVSQTISELGERGGGPNAIVMKTAGFMLPGLLFIAFAIGLHRGISRGRGSRIGPILLGIFGGGLVGSGIFSTDPNPFSLSISLISLEAMEVLLFSQLQSPPSSYGERARATLVLSSMFAASLIVSSLFLANARPTYLRINSMWHVITDPIRVRRE